MSISEGISPISSNDSPSYFYNPYTALANRVSQYSSMPEFKQDSHMQEMLKQSRELLNSLQVDNGIGSNIDIMA